MADGHAGNAPVAPSSYPITNGLPGGSEGKAGERRPYPHIDDITKVHLQVNPVTPLPTLVATAERHIMQAESLAQFKRSERSDTALNEYIKGCVVAVDVIPRHSRYPLLKVENKNLWDRTQRLFVQIKADETLFNQIKAEIKAQNAVTGVQPTPSRQGPNSTQSLPRATAEDGSAEGPNKNEDVRDVRPTSNGVAGNPRASPASKTKPAVHPKPQGLQGKALETKPGTGGGAGPLPQERAAKATQDLTARIAALRQSSAVQDPRIRTRPIVTTSPDVIQRPRSTTENAVPGLPRMPDAIYNPARGTVSSEASQLLSSTSGRFSMTRSVPSPSSPSMPFRLPSSTGAGSIRSHSVDWGSAAVDHSKGAEPTGPVSDIKIPDGSCISVLDLRRLLEAGEKKVKVLLIDIRHRERFDEYHINSSSTICIEPEVLGRKHVSASEISDSMVLAPPAEQIAFEKRASYDVIVFYDQRSQSVNEKEGTSTERPVLGLYEALSYFDCDQPDGAIDRKSPKLLQGGMDAWVAALGIPSGEGTGRPLVGDRASTLSTPVGPPRRKSIVARPLEDPADVKRWEDRLIRSPEELFAQPYREPESMTSPVPPLGARSTANHTTTNRQDHSRQGHHFAHISSEPKRPAPIVTRPSYSGLADRQDDDDHSRGSKPGGYSGRRRKSRQLVGLVNPGNWCYANSSLQAMYATSGFADELFDGDWREDYTVPMKLGEKIDNPQLTARMLTQLFQWMTRGMMRHIEPKTFMNYVRHLHSRNPNGSQKPLPETLGGPNQQDAHELFTFLITHIDDETNRRRNQKEQAIVIKDNDPRSLLHNAVKYWKNYSTMHDSLVTKYFRGLTGSTGVCTGCRNRSVNFETFDILYVNMLDGQAQSTCNLETLITKLQFPVVPSDYRCEACGSTGARYKRQTSFARFPDRLAICMLRGDDSDMVNKDNRKITFPFQNFDLSQYFIRPEDRAIDASDPELPDAEALAQDHHFQPSFMYNCYAVVCHVGSSLRSGHYIAYTKDNTSQDPTDWIQYDDDRAKRIKVTASGGQEDWSNKIYKDRHSTAYLVFYERKGT